MNDRLAYALAHPLSSGADDITAYQRLDGERDGNLLVSILAVDR